MRSRLYVRLQEVRPILIEITNRFLQIKKGHLEPLFNVNYLIIISKKLEDLSKKKVLVISSSLKKGLSSLLSEVWKRI